MTYIYDNGTVVCNLETFQVNLTGQTVATDSPAKRLVHSELAILLRRVSALDNIKEKAHVGS